MIVIAAAIEIALLVSENSRGVELLLVIAVTG